MDSTVRALYRRWLATENITDFEAYRKALQRTGSSLPNSSAVETLMKWLLPHINQWWDGIEIGISDTLSFNYEIDVAGPRSKGTKAVYLMGRPTGSPLAWADILLLVFCPEYNMFYVESPTTWPHHYVNFDLAVVNYVSQISEIVEEAMAELGWQRIDLEQLQTIRELLQ